MARARWGHPWCAAMQENVGDGMIRVLKYGSAAHFQFLLLLLLLPPPPPLLPPAHAPRACDAVHPNQDPNDMETNRKTVLIVWRLCLPELCDAAEKKQEEEEEDPLTGSQSQVQNEEVSTTVLPVS